MKYVRAKEPTHKVDISWPMTWIDAMAIRDDYEKQGYSTEVRGSTDGSKKVELYVYERMLIKQENNTK